LCYRYTIPQELPCRINSLYRLSGGNRLRRDSRLPRRAGAVLLFSPGLGKRAAMRLLGPESREAAAMCDAAGAAIQDRGK
jgi:hypothetical protein